MPSHTRYSAPMVLSRVKAASDAASSAPRPSTDSNITASAAVTLPVADRSAARGPWLIALVTHISMVGPGDSTSKATAAR